MSKNSSFLFSATQPFDLGLRAYLLKVYQIMVLGLLVSALTAYLGSLPFFMPLLFKQTSQGFSYSFLGWLIIFAPFILMVLFNRGLFQENPAKMRFIYWVFSGLVGFSFSAIFLGFSSVCLFQTFIICAGMFATLCLYGYTTKRNLTAIGNFCLMGVFGLVIAVIFNMFMNSSFLAYAVSLIGVLLFSVLTAYDMQKVKNLYQSNDSKTALEAKSILGAFILYLDFINLFSFLLSLRDRR